MATKSTIAGQHEDFENCKAGINNSSGNGSGPATEGSVAGSSALSRRATGPRTKLGKKRSSQNSLKHRIFSRAAILEDERWEQLDSLLQGLRQDLQPVGMLENMLVDKLASITWRHRRMLLAEKAEIRLGKWHNLLTEERKKQQREEAVILFGSLERPGPGLISREENPLIRQRIVQFLESLISLIKYRGFDPNYDMWILKVVFGESTQSEVLVTYSALSDPNIAKRTALSPDGLKAEFIEFLEKYIAIEKNQPDFDEWKDAQRSRLEILCSQVPEAPRLERLLRYEASLDRAFDRTLNQLERLQRMRKGQPVPPPINVNVAGS